MLSIFYTFCVGYDEGGDFTKKHNRIAFENHK
jgi:hypothetical protein